MARENNRKQSQMRARIATAAARLMAEDGIDDFALAKRKAARQLGASDTQSLPANEEVETELKAYQALYQGEEQRARIRELRAVALDAMRSLVAFNPYLAGAVLKGIAGRYADIDLQLFTDDQKAVEMFLVNRSLAYAVSEQRHYCGDEPRPVPVLTVEWRGVPLNLAVYAAKDERSSLKATPSGRPIERASLSTVSALVDSDG
jgi:CRISPR/Cas system CMR subunit Cmr6 (Cas7 group RAMP superfamily)